MGKTKQILVQLIKFDWGTGFFLTMPYIKIRIFPTKSEKCVFCNNLNQICKSLKTSSPYLEKLIYKNIDANMISYLWKNTIVYHYCYSALHILHFVLFGRKPFEKIFKKMKKAFTEVLIKLWHSCRKHIFWGNSNFSDSYGKETYWRVNKMTLKRRKR